MRSSLSFKRGTCHIMRTRNVCLPGFYTIIRVWLIITCGSFTIICGTHVIMRGWFIITRGSFTITVNDRLSARGAYLIFQLLGGRLFEQGRLFKQGRLLKF